MTKAITRRGLVAATPAALFAGVVPALAVAHPDADMLALRPLWLRVCAAYDATFGVLEAAERLCWDQRPDLPDFDSFDGSWTEFEAEKQRVLSFREALNAQTGVVEAERRQAEAGDAMDAVADKIFDMCARTVDGIRFKLEVLRKGYEDCEVSEYDASLFSDLLHVVGVHDA